MKSKVRRPKRAKRSTSKNKNGQQHSKQIPDASDRNVDIPTIPESRKPFKISEAFIRIQNEMDRCSKEDQTELVSEYRHMETEIPQLRVSHAFTRYNKDIDFQANNSIPSQEMIPETPENVSSVVSFNKGILPSTVKKNTPKLRISNKIAIDIENTENDEYDMEAFVDNEIKRKLEEKNKSIYDFFDAVPDIDRKFETAFDKLKGVSLINVDKKKKKKPKIKIAVKKSPKKRRKDKSKTLEMKNFNTTPEKLPSLIVEKAQNKICNSDSDSNFRKINFVSILSENTPLRKPTPRDVSQNIQSKKQETPQDSVFGRKIFQYDEHQNEISLLSPIMLTDNETKITNIRIIENILKNNIKNISQQYKSKLEELSKNLCLDLQEMIGNTLKEMEKKLVE